MRKVNIIEVILLKPCRPGDAFEVDGGFTLCNFVKILVLQLEGEAGHLVDDRVVELTDREDDAAEFVLLVLEFIVDSNHFLLLVEDTGVDAAQIASTWGRLFF